MGEESIDPEPPLDRHDILIAERKGSEKEERRGGDRMKTLPTPLQPGARFQWVDEPDGTWEVLRVTPGSATVKRVKSARTKTVTFTHETVKSKGGHSYKVERETPLVVEMPEASRTLTISVNSMVAEVTE